MSSKLFFLGAVSLLNLGLWTYIIFGSKNILLKFLFLTIINYTINTFYLTIRFIYEFLTHINRNDHHKINSLEKNGFFQFINTQGSKFSFSLCITVCQVYWLLVLGGDKLMIFPTNKFVSIFLGIYLHFFTGVIITIDMFIIKVIPNKKIYYRDLIIYCLILIIYSFILVILAKNYEKCVIYPFLRLDIVKIVAINIIISICFRNSFQFYHYIHKRNKPKERNINKHKLSSETQKSETDISIDKPLFGDRNV